MFPSPLTTSPDVDHKLALMTSGRHPIVKSKPSSCLVGNGDRVDSQSMVLTKKDNRKLTDIVTEGSCYHLYARNPRKPKDAVSQKVPMAYCDRNTLLDSSVKESYSSRRVSSKGIDDRKKIQSLESSSLVHKSVSFLK